MESLTFFDSYLWIITLGVSLFLIDDLIIDAIAYFKNLGPQEITKETLFDPKNNKLLAIMIANWKEEDVLEAMIHGNMAQIKHSHVHFFLGVYPNDHATLKIAQKMAAQYQRVHVVINSKDGPTYKGQMLNEIIKTIFQIETSMDLMFEGFVLHDSEDILDPLIPQLYSLGLRQADFVQTPVFSLETKINEWVAGTYMDEFAEGHTKDLLVRQHLKASIPSAGVGTCLSRRLTWTFFVRQNGEVFLPNSLTEDYQLGMQTTQWDFKSIFLCRYLEGTDPSKIISTKEFFPHQFWHSVRQKTRWTAGIAFQGFQNIGWFGNLTQNYFLWRDRRGPLNSFLSLNLILLLLMMPFYDVSSQSLATLLTINSIGMGVRFTSRFRSLCYLYSTPHAFMSLVRWPVAMTINMLAGLRSTYQFFHSQFTGETLRWVKTQHRLPEGFGQVIEPTFQMEGLDFEPQQLQENLEQVNEANRTTGAL